MKIRNAANQWYPLFEPMVVFWWWYSHGLISVLSWTRESMRQTERDIGLVVWMKAIFVPMYGQWDWRGRAISFCFRVLVIIWKALRESMLLLWYLVVLSVYCVIPVVAVSLIVQGIRAIVS